MTSSWSEKLPSAFADAPAPIVVQRNFERKETKSTAKTWDWHTAASSKVLTHKKKYKHTKIEN